LREISYFAAASVLFIDQSAMKRGVYRHRNVTFETHASITPNDDPAFILIKIYINSIYSI